MKLLYVNANPKPIEMSYSLQVGQHFLETLQQLRHDLTVERVDVYKDNVPLINAAVFAAWGKLEKGDPLDEGEKVTLDRMSQLLEQFIACDVYVFATPLWNLSYPPMFKAYIDNIVVARKTFQYTPTGPVGLLHGQGKKAVHIQAAGGVHSHGPIPEYANDHLKAIMNFIGVEEYHYVPVEGMSYDPTKAPEIVAAGKRRVEELAKIIAK